MNKKLTFIKLSNRWFVDIPWDGMLEDLEMVNGADIFLEAISFDNKIVNIDIYTTPMDNYVQINKVQEDEFGAYYKINTFEYKGEIWLCNVTKHLFNEFPQSFWIKY
jgi:hypothetical protein